MRCDQCCTFLSSSIVSFLTPSFDQWKYRKKFLCLSSRFHVVLQCSDLFDHHEIHYQGNCRGQCAFCYGHHESLWKKRTDYRFLFARDWNEESLVKIIKLILLPFQKFLYQAVVGYWPAVSTCNVYERHYISLVRPTQKDSYELGSKTLFFVNNKSKAFINVRLVPRGWRLNACESQTCNGPLWMHIISQTLRIYFKKSQNSVVLTAHTICCFMSWDMSSTLTTEAIKLS